MKVIFTTVRELSNNKIDVLIHEKMDTEIAITSDGYCFIKGGPGISEKLDAITTHQIMNMFEGSQFVFAPYIKAINDTSPLDAYYKSNTFMVRVYEFLLHNKYITMTKLAEAVNIDKKIGKMLISKLLFDEMISTYSTYYRVTDENIIKIADAIKSLTRPLSLEGFEVINGDINVEIDETVDMQINKQPRPVNMDFIQEELDKLNNK